MSIPNLVTIARILLVPVIFWLMATDRMQAAFIVFVIAGVSDALDGFLAKRYGWQTEVGAHLDPLADKLLVVSVFLAMGYSGGLPLWIVVAVVSRDLLIVAAVVLAWVLGNPFQIKPLWVSKATTAAQIVLAATVLAKSAFGLAIADLLTVLVWVTGLLTLLSLAAYLKAWLVHMSQPSAGP
ncbi:MAG: CDP-alcohol phosphatidyltransferase family protein [Hyphomicrobiaceae bacterium]